MSQQDIYLDYASTTPVKPEVLKAMTPYFTEMYGNAESRHTQGKNALIAIDNARDSIAQNLNCKASEITFTGTATEANNIAILGIARKNQNRGKHIISTPIEHSSVKNCLAQLEKEGFKVTYLPVDQHGLISLQDLKDSIQPDTTLISIIYGNNEIGTIQPIKEIGEIAKQHDIPFHTDACQTACTESIDTKDLNVTAMTLNGSKIYGPKGVGILYTSQEIKIQKVSYGGTHEHNLRPGTHNTPNIVGMATALQLAQENKESEKARLTTLRDKLIKGLLENISDCRLNGHPTKRLANNVNISIDNIETPQLLLILDQKGIYASAGSACMAGSAQLSHVLKAIYAKDKNPPVSSLRLTLGKDTTAEEIDYVIDTLKEVIPKLRK